MGPRMRWVVYNLLAAGVVIALGAYGCASKKPVLQYPKVQSIDCLKWSCTRLGCACVATNKMSSLECGAWICADGCHCAESARE